MASAGPAQTSYLLGRYWRRFHQIPLADFSGGLNLRDAATELAPNESPDLMNVTLDERGGVVKRLGYLPWNTTPAANLITQGYVSDVAKTILWYSQTDGKLYTDPGSGVLTATRTWTAGKPIGIVDFAGKLYANHPVDGLYQSTDGAAWTQVSFASGSAPNGSLMTVWQNKLWIADPSSNLLTFSAPGDATKWDSADDAGSNHIREGNDYPIVALYGGAGTDFQSLPTLLVGKRSGGGGSLHRVTDAATGDYITLDQTIGPAGPQSLASLYGRIYVLSTSGIFATDGQTPLVPVGQKIAPLFLPNELDYSQATQFCAGVNGHQIFFSVARAGSPHNDLCLEYNPLFGAFTARTDAVNCYLGYRASGDVLIGASVSLTRQADAIWGTAIWGTDMWSAGGYGQLFRLNTGGSDNGDDIQSWFLTRVFEPLGGLEARLQRVRLKMRSPALKMQVLTDFAITGTQYTLAAAQGAGGSWGIDQWGTGVWGSGDTPEAFTEVWPRQGGRAFQLRFDETSALTSATPKLLETGATVPVGGWALYSADLSASLIGFT